MFELKVGHIYMAVMGPCVLIVSELDKTSPEYNKGFRFLGSDGCAYTPSGNGQISNILYQDITDIIRNNVFPDGPVVETQEEANTITLTFPYKEPHGWIQWKGTNVCMDFHCRCGHHNHIDAEFAYYIKCAVCQRTYACDGHIKLVEYTGPSNPMGIQPISSADDVDLDDLENIKHRQQERKTDV